MSAPLWFANFLSYCLQVILLVLAGTALPALFRMRAPRVLLAYWQGLLVVCLLLPLLQPWKHLTAGSTAGAGITTISFESVPAAAAGFHPSLYRIFFAVLVAGMLIRLAWLAVGLGRLRAICRAARPLDPLPPCVGELKSRIDVSAVLYLAPRLDGPATFGIRPASILLPERFPTLGEPFQRAIAGHELLHVARHDWMYNLGEELILTLFWFHPGVAWVVNRIRLSREQAVDAEVVRLFSARKPYMSALLEVATGGLVPAPWTAPTFLKERQLANRIELLVKEVTMSKLRLSLSLCTMISMLILAGGAGVWAFPLRAPWRVTAPAAEPAGEEAAPVAASTLKVVKKVRPVYPAEAKKAGVEGVVTLRATIEKDGSVSNLEVVSGPPQLVKAALDAVRQWRYEPSEKAIITDVKINFSLLDKAAAAPQASANRGEAAMTDTHPAEGVTRPQVISKTDPPYTKEAKDAKVQGTVILRITVDANGNVTDAEVEKGLDKGLDENAVNTLKTWKFKPATKNGKPVSSKLSVEVSFKFF